jgi:L-lactate dehydrogenase complex protein LldF
MSASPQEPVAGGEQILSPALPYNMHSRADAGSRNIRLQQFVKNATSLKDHGRVQTCRDAFGENYDAVRRLAGQIKQHTLDSLDRYIEQFIDAATKAGVQVHFAASGEEANRICLEIARNDNCRLCVKAKSMVTEETHLVPALQAAGIETIETDLGEFILQLDHDAPSHIVTPMIHKDRTDVARAFTRELGAEYTEDPARLTAIAREHLRRKFRAADMGISGANFLIAETGSLVICTNEGNADLCIGVPKTHIALVGIEKVIPTLAHLPIFLKLLARSATSQPITVYTSIITGPRRVDERDGPEQVHIILLDNGRTELLREETRELLRCIRCGACLNACPVYRNVGGGHAYGAVYSGPIGAAITPLFKGIANYPDLPHASSLCGACFEACPVAIDIPTQLIRLRAQMAERGLAGPRERMLMRLWATVLKRPWLYRRCAALNRMVLRWMGSAGSPTGAYSDRRWIQSTRGLLSGWTASRDLPTPTSKSFRDWWDARPRKKGNGP